MYTGNISFVAILTVQSASMKTEALIVKIKIIKASKNFRITAAIEDIGYLNPPSKNCLYTSSKMVTLLKLVLYV